MRVAVGISFHNEFSYPSQIFSILKSLRLSIKLLIMPNRCLNPNCRFGICLSNASQFTPSVLPADSITRLRWRRHFIWAPTPPIVLVTAGLRAPPETLLFHQHGLRHADHQCAPHVAADSLSPYSRSPLVLAQVAPRADTGRSSCSDAPSLESPPPKAHRNAMGGPRDYRGWGGSEKQRPFSPSGAVWRPHGPLGPVLG